MSLARIEVPDIARVWHANADRFGRIYDGSAAHCQNEIDFFLTAKLYALAYQAHRGIGLDAAKFNPLNACAFQGGAYPAQKARFFCACTTKMEQHFFAIDRGFLANCILHSFTENDLCRITKNEIVHLFIPLVMSL